MILAIDTAGPWVAVAVGDDGVVKAEKAIAARLNHNEVLAALVRGVLETAEIERPSKIAVNTGPGSFTGTRVGVSFAVGLAQGWNVPVAVFSSFEVAATLASGDADAVCVAFPVVGSEWCRARMLRGDAGWTEESLDELDRDEVESDLDGMPLIVPWGDSKRGIHPPPNWNPATALVSLASESGEVSAAAAVQVRYVGLSQAERNFHARKQSR